MGKVVRDLRQHGIILAILTGHDMQPLAIQVRTFDIDRLLTTQGRATVIPLSVAAKDTTTRASQAVMIGHVKRDAISGAIAHTALPVSPACQQLLELAGCTTTGSLVTSSRTRYRRKTVCGPPRSPRPVPDPQRALSAGHQIRLVRFSIPWSLPSR